MKSFLFSVLHPTLARPEVAIKRCLEWLAKADRPAEVEYIFGLHSFDTPANRQRLEEFAAAQSQRVVLSMTPRRGSSSNWNQTAAAAYGHLLIQAQDDLAPPEGWDRQLLQRLERQVGADWMHKPVFVTVSDGHRKDRLCITTIITQVYRNQRGFFLFPEYDGLYADDDSTAQAYDDAAAGRVRLIEARDLVFEHQHFTYEGGMSFDETYASENSSVNYREGEALFARRHPRWHREQLCRTPPPMPNREAGAAAPAPAAAAPSPSAGDTPATTPVVSVIIPCYNQAPYLAEAVQSVIAQTFGDWEVIMVNDGSPDNTSEVAQALIVNHPACRLRLIEKPNGGVSDARNVGIRAARGRYILPLDGDDKIDPQFLARTVALLDRDPEVGIAYTDWVYFGALQATRNATDYDFARLCTKENLFTCTALFRKEAWAAAGGFNPNMTRGVEDWDFWIGCGEHGFKGRRIPEPLFFYRAKEGGRNEGALPDLPAMFARIVLNHPKLYQPEAVQAARRTFEAAGLPPPKPTSPGREWLPPKDRTETFDQIIASAETCVRENRLADAIAQVERALSIAPSAECADRAREIIASLQAAIPAAPSAETEPAEGEIFEEEDVRSIEHLLAAYSDDPADATNTGKLLSLQQGMMNYLVTTPIDRLEALFQGSFGRVFRAVTRSGLPSEPPTDESRAQLAVLDEALAGTPDRAKGFDYRPVFARMLRAPAHRGTIAVPPENLPGWFRDDYLGYLLAAPQVFVAAGEAEAYHAHLLAWSRAIHQRIKTAPAAPTTKQLATVFATKMNCIPLYSSAANTREFSRLRAAILEFVLTGGGAVLEAKLPRRPNGRKKIKVGFLSAHFGAQTETHVTLPALQLDREKFEVHLFALMANPGPIEDRCRSFADSFTPLPENLCLQVKQVREAALDVLIVGTNITAVTNSVALLAAHRLAPVQLATYCSPVSPGFRQIDGYLTGTQMRAAGVQDHFTEKLHYCEGAPGCLDYTVEGGTSARTFTREGLGLASDDVVFVNAASCFKILPELQETWARILQAVPHSRLLLLPFNPNWANEFPVKQFTRTMEEALRRHGVAPDRLILSGPLPSRADVKALERLADVYLDTFPFSGSLSVIDPLELGLPTAVWQGETPRSRAAAALLRELKLPELIADNEADYVRLAVRLGTDPDWRKAVGERIHAAMQARPVFLDAPEYGRRLGRLLETLVPGHRAPAAERQLVEV